MNMKKYLFKLSWLFLAALVTFTACETDDDDDDDDNGTLVEDGFYLKGAATALTELSSTGQLKVTRNEVLQENRSDLLEIFVAVQSGSEGFNLVEVAGAEQKTYGPGTDFVEITGDALDGEEPTLGLWKGSYAESTTPFTVPENGLYHIAIDKELQVVVIAKVEWGVIGAATPGGWSSSTQLTEGTFDKNSIAFEINDLELTKADFKFRYSNGWKIILDADYDLGSGNKGIKVNTNFGGSISALVPGGDNINNETPGKYTVTMTWSLTGGHVATATKTGDSETPDYTDTELGLVGNGLIINDTVAGWETTILLSTPEVANTKYTWTWTDVTVVDTGSFKIREGQNWEGLVIGYPQVTLTGSAADKFETNADGNFVPLESGAYNFILDIEATTSTYTLNVEPGGTPIPEHYWGIIGSSVPPYDWSVDVDMTWDYTTNIWSITIDLVTGEFKFRADDDWALAYGIDGEGNLTDAGGSPNIPLTEDGNYTIELILTDPEAPTYTVTKN